MTDNSNHQLVVRAKFNFQQTNEDELSFTKGDIIHVTRVEEGGWWEGTHNGKTGWFPSNYVREVKSNGEFQESAYKLPKLTFFVDFYVAYIFVMMHANVSQLKNECEIL